MVGAAFFQRRRDVSLFRRPKCAIPMTSIRSSSTPKYEPTESPPHLESLGLGIQSALLVVAPIALFPIVLFNAVDASDAAIAWAVFAMLVVNGGATIMQAFRAGPVGAGMLVIPYPSPTAIPFCVIALEQGGASTLAALIVTSGLFQVALSMRLSLIRRLVTPAISGAVLILLIITVVPVLFEGLNDVPDGAPAAAAPVCILVTFAVTVGLLLRGSGFWRVWSALIGIAAGAIAGIAFGIYDFGPAQEASAAGLPWDGWAGLGFSFGLAYWSLLPAFLFLALLSLLQGTSIGLSIQRVSWRTPRAMDYRRVQGLSLSNALWNLVAGLAAVMPIATQPKGDRICAADRLRRPQHRHHNRRRSHRGSLLPQVMGTAYRNTGAGHRHLYRRHARPSPGGRHEDDYPGRP